MSYTANQDVHGSFVTPRVEKPIVSGYQLNSVKAETTFKRVCKEPEIVIRSYVITLSLLKYMSKIKNTQSLQA